MEKVEIKRKMVCETWEHIKRLQEDLQLYQAAFNSATDEKTKAYLQYRLSAVTSELNSLIQ